MTNAVRQLFQIRASDTHRSRSAAVSRSRGDLAREAPAVDGVAPGPRVGAQSANVPIRVGSEGAKEGPRSSRRSVSAVDRNINGSNENRVYSRHSESAASQRQLI